MNIEYDDFADFHQTNKLYEEIKKYYSNKFDNETPFLIIAVHINECVRRFKRKPKLKVIHLSFKYLDEIGYKG